MKKDDFVKFDSRLEANIIIDCYLRRITEKLKVVSNSPNTEHLRSVSHILDDADRSLTNYILKELCDHEQQED